MCALFTRRDAALLLAMADTLSGGAYRPLSEYLRATLERGLRATGRDTDRLDEAMNRAAAMPPFPDAGLALASRREAGIGTGVLTNSTTESAERALVSAGLHERVDVVIGTD